MPHPPFFPRFEDLPATLPVFPLAGVLLLPRGQLPLNIFEPRYVAMTDDALAGDRIIGMIQPREEETGAAGEGDEGAGDGAGRRGPPLYEIGCAGRITSLDETEDGRYLVTLTGLCRFRIRGEVPTMRGYRRCLTDWADFAEDMEDAGEGTGAGVDRDRLLAALSEYFRATGLSANWQAIEQTPVERLVTSLAMICPFEPREKQALLEAPDLGRRATLMMSVLELAAHAREGEGGLRH